MKKALFAAVLVALSANAAQAAPITYTAVLSGANEVPAVPTTGTGSATITYDPVTHLLGLNINFANLVSPTTASHIHCCALQPGNNAGVATTTPTFAGFPARRDLGLLRQYARSHAGVQLEPVVHHKRLLGAPSPAPKHADRGTGH